MYLVYRYLIGGEPELGIYGHRSDNPHHALLPFSLQMLIDVLTDRGFRASHSGEVTHVPVQIDLSSGLIRNRKESRHRFRISWDCSSVRDWQALEMAARVAENSAKDPRISQSFIPPPPPPGSTQAGAAASQKKSPTAGGSSDDAYLIFGS